MLIGMSGLTSQPSMGAVIAALERTPLDTGIDFKNIQALNSYWEQIRLVYSCFDAGMKSADSGVYEHEMPGKKNIFFGILFSTVVLKGNILKKKS